MTELGTSVCGRLAPTPSGMLHLGNIAAFAAAWLSVRAQRGRLLLRFEDVDRARARADIQRAQRQDLQWLGFDWDKETPAQSTRSYEAWLARLDARCYHCRCSRKDRQRTGGVYTGTCRQAAHSRGARRFWLESKEESFDDRLYGQMRVEPDRYGDPVLQRADGVFNYNLAVVVDDIRDGVSEVVRGADLLDYTAVQLQLWRAFEREAPTWLHTPLILGPDGKKLSKSHQSVSVFDLRQSGWQPSDIWTVVMPWLGCEGSSLVEALTGFQAKNILRGPLQLEQTPAAPGAIPWQEAEPRPNF